MRILKFLAGLVLAVSAVAAPPNWDGGYQPCLRNPELLTHNHVDLLVRISTSNPILARQFSRALDFWSQVVDLDWRKAGSEDCTIQLVDGSPGLFDASGTAARSQFPDRAEFQGCVAFNPAARLTEREMFLISVHEIGHLLGLPHNSNGASVMYFLQLDGSAGLDAKDLAILSALHPLRGESIAAIPVQ